MPKNFFQDMVVAKRQSQTKQKEPKETREEARIDDPTPIRKNPPVEKITPRVEQRKPEPVTQNYDEPIETKFTSVYDVVDRDRTSAGKSRRAMWSVAFVSALFLLFALSFAFSGAHITIEPKIQDLALDKVFSAALDGDPGQFSFDLIALSGQEEKEIQGGEEKDAAASAKGSVVIFNNFSSAAQNLDINTRLEGSNGKIYKTETKVSVPGMKGTTPGSIEVKVYATEAGEEYNTGPIDFTIFGFKGSPKYSKFYARSKGDIAGGFIGKMRAVSEGDKALARQELKDALLAKLQSQATLQIPPGFVLLKDAVFLNIDSEEVGESTSAMVPLVMKGTLYGILFEEKNLNKEIAKAVVSNYDQSEVYIPNVRELNFSLQSKDNVSFKDTRKITFTLNGTPKVVWNVDSEKVIDDVFGKHKKEFEQIMSQYPNIHSAELSLRPFWKRSLPNDRSQIKVSIKKPE